MNRPHQLCMIMLAFALLCGLWTLPAHADEVAGGSVPPSSADALTDQARELHVKGAELFANGQYAQAEAAFLAAWALKKHFQISANLGACELKLGKWRSAAEHLAHAARTFVPHESQERATALSLLAEAKKKVSAIVLKVDVGGADVSVDGKAVGVSPLLDPLFLDPGPHTIEARRNGELRASAKIDAKVGSEEMISMSVTGATTPTGGARKELLVAGGASAGAALVAGVVLAAASGGRGSDAGAIREQKEASEGLHACGVSSPECEKYRAAINEQDALGNASVWSFVAAGLLGGGTVVYGLVAPSASEQKSAKVGVLPVVSPSAGGLVVRVVW